MPEGDTLHRVAARLRPALVDKELVTFAAPRLVGERPLVGETIDRVQARGKHLLIGFSGGLTVQSHLRMTGSWHIYRVGERWQLPSHQMRLQVGTADWDAVCFRAPIVRSMRGTDPTDHLGPDLIDDDEAAVDIVARLRRRLEPATDVASALLDQRIAAGIGNVYKCEALFDRGVDPETPVGDLPDELVGALYEVARRQLRSNLGPGRRSTVAGGLAVYGRVGKPCRRCGTVIARKPVGDPPRSTYYCPACQVSTR